MRFAVVTGNTDLFRLICQCFPPENHCNLYESDHAFAQEAGPASFDALLFDASDGLSLGLPTSCRADAAPTILFGVQDTPESLEQAFATGADDVVLGPFNCTELYMRTQLALIRAERGPAVPETLDYHGYHLDHATHTVQLDGETITLTAREFAVTWLLFSRPGDYVSRTQLAEAIWASTEEIVGRSIEQHIYKLRKKLRLNGEGAVYLRTMYAHGYRVEPSGAMAVE